MRPHLLSERLYARPMSATATIDPELVIQTLALFTPEVQRTLPGHWPAVTDESSAAQWLEDRLEEAWPLTVRLRADHSLVGFLLINPGVTVEIGPSWHIGYLLGEPYWRQGFATELVGSLVDWCDTHQQVACLRAGVLETHPASARVLEKNGFTEVALADGPAGVRFFERHFHSPASPA
ncbi:GNAT family N-acetyltransferase [Marinobacter hydrocarbonoclasticus]|nr:GNAT family N-acetyltransferase [Marinobacter nauticus]